MFLHLVKSHRSYAFIVSVYCAQIQYNNPKSFAQNNRTAKIFQLLDWELAQKTREINEGIRAPRDTDKQ